MGDLRVGFYIAFADWIGVSFLTLKDPGTSMAKSTKIQTEDCYKGRNRKFAQRKYGFFEIK